MPMKMAERKHEFYEHSSLPNSPTSPMTRPEHLRVARLTTDDIGALLDAVAGVAERVELAFLWRPVLPDADDDMVLEYGVGNGHE